MSRFKDIAKKEIELAKDNIPKADKVVKEKKHLRQHRDRLRRKMERNFLTPPPCQKCGEEHNPSLSASNIVIFPASEESAVFLCRSCMHPYLGNPKNAPLDFTPINVVKMQSPEKVWKSFERFYIALLLKHFRISTPWDITQCTKCQKDSLTLSIKREFKLGEAEVVCDECGYARRIRIFKF